MKDELDEFENAMKQANDEADRRMVALGRCMCLVSAVVVIALIVAVFS